MSAHDPHPSPIRSRRSLLRAGLGTAVGLGLAATAATQFAPPRAPVGAANPTVTSFALSPGEAGTATALAAATNPTVMPSALPRVIATYPPPLAPTAWQAYHGVTESVHQARAADLSARGYRIISLSVAGDPANARYAAVWIQRLGPAQLGIQGVTRDEFGQRSNTAYSQGYRIALIAAVGAGENARYAAVFEQGLQGFFDSDKPYRRGNPDASYVSAFRYIRNDAYTPASFAIYGEPPTAGDNNNASGRYYWAATYRPTALGLNPFIVTPDALDADAYQQVFNDFSGRGYYPITFAVTPDHRYAAVFVNAPNVGRWIGRHNLTADEYQQAFDEATAQGLIPLTVQAGGTGDDIRYAATFAQLVP